MITSHMLSDLDDMVTEVIYMQEGKLRFHKSLNQLKEDTGLTGMGLGATSALFRDFLVTAGAL